MPYIYIQWCLLPPIWKIAWKRQKQKSCRKKTGSCLKEENRLWDTAELLRKDECRGELRDTWTWVFAYYLLPHAVPTPSLKTCLLVALWAVLVFEMKIKTSQASRSSATWKSLSLIINDIVAAYGGMNYLIFRIIHTTKYHLLSFRNFLLRA